MGAKDRETNQVSTRVVGGTDRDTLQGFIAERMKCGAVVYADDDKGYIGLALAHVAVNHSRGQYVQGEADTSGIESFWSMLKRAYMGTFHHLSQSTFTVTPARSAAGTTSGNTTPSTRCWPWWKVWRGYGSGTAIWWSD